MFIDRAMPIAQAEPERTLLIDDRDQNLAPAATLGMQTFRYKDPELLARVVADAGLF